MHQRQFLPFTAGCAPTVRSLAAGLTPRVVLAATDRSVSLVRFTEQREYTLESLPLEGCDSDTHVLAAAAIERTDPQPGLAVAVALAHGEKLSLLVQPLDASPAPSRFELAAAPLAITSVRAQAATERFVGVLVFCADAAIAAFGYVDATVASAAEGVEPECVRLSGEQLARFFPEFAAFTHPVLAVDTLVLRASATSYVAFGCADGVLRVFQGRAHDQDGSSCGPYTTYAFQIDGPVTAISLFATETHGRVQCNVLATCAIGHALVVEDVFGHPTTELLEGSDHFDSIFAGLAVDVDLDGNVELLLGTDDQRLLVYKRTSPVGLDNPTGKSGDHHDLETRVAADEGSTGIASVSHWKLQPTSACDVQVFGAIYSLAHVDVNDDGVKELLVASSTGVFVYEADPALVLRRLEALLSLSGRTGTHHP